MMMRTSPSAASPCATATRSIASPPPSPCRPRRARRRLDLPPRPRPRPRRRAHADVVRRAQGRHILLDREEVRPDRRRAPRFERTGARAYASPRRSPTRNAAPNAHCRRNVKLVSAFFILHSAFAAVALARVERVEVLSRADYPHNYERIKARVYYAVDPANPHDAIIADIDKAPRNARGEVEFSGDVDIVRPKDGGNGVANIYVVNRGGRFFVRDRNPDPWYLRQGFTLVDLA